MCDFGPSCTRIFLLYPHISFICRFGSLYEKDFKDEILSVCGSFCPDEKHTLFQSVDQLQQPPQLQLQDQPPLGSTVRTRLSLVSIAFILADNTIHQTKACLELCLTHPLSFTQNGGGGGTVGPVSGEGSQNGGVGGADGIVPEEQSQNECGGGADGVASGESSGSAVPTGDLQQAQPPPGRRCVHAFLSYTAAFVFAIHQTKHILSCCFFNSTTLFHAGRRWKWCQWTRIRGSVAERRRGWC